MCMFLSKAINHPIIFMLIKWLSRYCDFSCPHVRPWPTAASSGGRPARTEEEIHTVTCGRKWGADPSTLLTLYKSYVRSLIDYGSFIYFPKSQQHIETLEKIQFTNLRALMGCRFSTPIDVIIAEYKIQSIRERTTALCKCCLIKILSNSNHPQSSNQTSLKEY